MAKSGVLTVKVVGNADKFNQTMNDVQGRLGKVAGGMAKFGKVVAVGTVAAAGGAAALGNEVLNTGAKLTAWRQKTATVFEGSAADIREWADKNNEVFGVTDDELAGLAASFGDLLKPMGFTADQAAAMSQDVVGLSGALSEWSGGQRSAAEVSNILSKAMLGEREGLKELGISITQAEVDARLLEKGQQDLTGAALQQAAAVATQELIFAKSTDAQAAFAAGGNEALRAQNGLKAGLAELREQLADRLLPIVTTITQWLVANLPVAFERAGQIAADLKAKWDEIFPALQAVFQTFQLVVQTVIDTVSGLFTRSESDVGGSASRIGGILTQMSSVFSSVFGAIQVLVETWVRIVTDLWDRFGEDLMSFAREAFAAVTEIVRAALNVITGVFDLFVAVFTGDWAGAWEAIKKIVDGAWDFIVGTHRAALAVVQATIQVALGAISAVWSATWNVMKTLVSDAWEGIKSLVSGAVDAVVGFVASLPGRISGAASGAFDGIKNAFRTALNWIVDAWNRLSFPSFSIPKVSIPGLGDLGGGTIGGWALPSIPRFHSGGVFRAPRMGGEGLALLKDGETVLPTRKSQEVPNGGMGSADAFAARVADVLVVLLQQRMRAA